MEFCPSHRDLSPSCTADALEPTHSDWSSYSTIIRRCRFDYADTTTETSLELISHLRILHVDASTLRL